jgi:hypothetical protein
MNKATILGDDYCSNLKAKDTPQCMSQSGGVRNLDGKISIRRKEMSCQKFHLTTLDNRKTLCMSPPTKYR